MNKQTILITGSGGFVGSHIVNHLQDNCNLLTPRSYELNLLNFQDVEYYFQNNEIDIVIHCALSGREFLSSHDPVYLSDGLIMFRNLFNQRKHFDKFINLGTAYELSLDVDNTLINEDDFLSHLPITSYGLAKNLIARTIRETPKFFNLRLFGVFHETESERRFLKKVRNEEHIIIEKDSYFDYLYLPDMFPILDRIINNHCQIRDLNMVYANKYRLSEIAYMLCDHLGLDKNKITIKNQKGLNLTGSPNKIQTLDIDFIGLEKGIRNYT